jgi:hypothetical protein
MLLDIRDRAFRVKRASGEPADTKFYSSKRRYEDSDFGGIDGSIMCFEDYLAGLRAVDAYSFACLVSFIELGIARIWKTVVNAPDDTTVIRLYVQGVWEICSDFEDGDVVVCGLIVGAYHNR